VKSPGQFWQSKFQSQTRSRSTRDRLILTLEYVNSRGFNLRREAAPRATITRGERLCVQRRFQSQTRSRSTRDVRWLLDMSTPEKVSISDEKPLHARQYQQIMGQNLPTGFQSQTRSRSTRDNAGTKGVLSSIACFNLRREAAPRATGLLNTHSSVLYWFQSQTRSRSTRDTISLLSFSSMRRVSISDEKPLHARPRRVAAPQL